jgi:hypothetical protein
LRRYSSKTGRSGIKAVTAVTAMIGIIERSLGGPDLLQRRGRSRLGTKKYDLAFSRGKLASKRDLSFATGHMLKRHLLIITRRAPRTYEAMKQSFGDYAGIDVILDLRYRQRRWKWWCKRAIEIRE